MMQGKVIRVLIADDHDMLRRGLALFIEMRPDLRLIGEACDGQEAVDLCQQLHPDVVLMDLMMPGMDGITSTGLIHEQFPEIHIIVLTGYVDESLVTAALTAGAISYLLKDVSSAALWDAIHDACAHKATLAPEAAQALVNAAHRSPMPDYSLSRREQEVLNLMIQGQSNTEIADHLVIGVSTVKKHVSNIFCKLKIGTRTEAVALAVRHHLVDE